MDLLDLSPRPGDLDPIETASRDELEALQLTRLQASLRRAYEHVPHYRRAFDEAGVHPDDVTSLEDLAKFPFTSKADLRDNYPFGMFAVPRSEVVRVHVSSGTTGRPTVVGYKRNDVDTWAEVEKVTGRSDDMMIIRGVNLFPTQFEELILAEVDLSPHFQCVLTHPSRLDELTIRVESRTLLSSSDAAVVAERVAERAKATTGASVRFEVLAPGSVERSAGKMKRIVDER